MVVAGELMLIEGVTRGIAVTFSEALLVHPVLLSVTTTEYVPVAEAVIPAVTSVVDQAYEYPAPLGWAVSVTLPPAQKVVGPPADTEAVIEFTRTEVLAFDEQFAAL